MGEKEHTIVVNHDAYDSPLIVPWVTALLAVISSHNIKKKLPQYKTSVPIELGSPELFFLSL